MVASSSVESLIRGLTGLHEAIGIDDLFDKAADELRPPVDRNEPYEQALEGVCEIGLRGGDNPEDLHLLRTVGSVYERLLHLEPARRTFKQALEMAERLSDPQARAAVLARLGRILTLHNEWDEALRCLDAALEAYGELADDTARARVLIDRGVIFHERGDYGAAAELYAEAAALAETAGARDVTARATNNQAVLATIRGDSAGAAAQYRACLEIYDEIGDQREAARSYHNLGMTQADNEDWDAAAASFSRSLEIAKEHQQLDVMANVSLSQGELLLDLGDSTLVTLCGVRALEIYKKIGDRLGEADAYRLLGRLFTLREQWPTAAALFADSLRLNEEYENPLGLAETHRDVGRLQAARGNPTDARASLSTALEGFRSLQAHADGATVERLLSELD